MKHRKLFVFCVLVLSTILISSCAPAPTQAPSQPTQSSAQVKATAVATTAPVTSAATSVPTTPTSLPPTATKLPPTATPLPSATPVPLTPTTPPTPVPPTAAAQLSGACANAYYPVKQGAQWQYRTQLTGSAPSVYTVTYTTIGIDGFTERRTFPGLTSDISWRCTADGLISNEFAQLNLTNSATQFKFETTKISGVTIPASARWQVGTTWDNSYDVKGEMVAQSMSTTIQGSITLNNKMAAVETVTVPTGTYNNAMRVDTKSTMKLTTTVSGFTAPIEMVFNTSTWYAQGVGMVKSTYSGDMGSSTTELIVFK